MLPIDRKHHANETRDTRQTGEVRPCRAREVRGQNCLDKREKRDYPQEFAKMLMSLCFYLCCRDVMYHIGHAVDGRPIVRDERCEEQ